MIAAVLLWLLSLLYPVGYAVDGSRFPVVSYYTMSLSEMRELNFRDALRDSPWPRQLREAVVELARCESRFESDAVSADGQDFGDLQIRRSAHPEFASLDLLDRRQNLAAGYTVYQKQGWTAWACYR